MTYLVGQSSRNRHGWRGPFFAVAGLVAIAAAMQLLLPYAFPALFMTLARPFWRMEFSANEGSFSSPDALLRENEDLKRQLSDAAVRMQSASALLAENEELKTALGRASSTPYILAAVLRRPPLTLHDEFIIDIGADYGIAVGNLAYAPGDVLIGRVSAVFGQTSTVTLFSSPGEKYPVEIGTTHAPATALGQGGGQYASELPRTVPVNEGDGVLVPSLESIPFAAVVSVITDPVSPFEKILFAPPVNVYEERWVLIDPKSKFTAPDPRSFQPPLPR